MAEILVNVVTPLELVYSGIATDISVPGWEGEFDVLPGHDVVLSLVRAGMLRIGAVDGEKRFLIGRGFVEVTGNKVTVLTDSVQDPSTADKAAASEDMNQAEARMAIVGSVSGEWAGLEERRELASAILGL